MKKIYFLVLLLSFFTSVNAQIINFPDANLKAELITDGVDTNNDGQISQAEALVPVNLSFTSSNITNVSGIEFFTNLTTLSFSGNNLTSFNLSLLSGMTNLGHFNLTNNQIQSLDLSGINNLTHLQTFNCNQNQIQSLDLSSLNNLPQLQQFNCTYNNLTTINTSGCNLPNLEMFDCDNNQLTNINISNLPMLFEFDCHLNNLTGLTILNCPWLRTVYCHNNQLVNINISNCNLLSTVVCDGNPLVSIDFSHLPNLDTLMVKNDPLLTSINVKNGHSAKVEFNNANTNLRYLCCDESVVAYHQNQNDYFLLTPLPNFSINSYCSFVPGGTFYTIQGNSKFDQNNDGCGASDIGLPNLRFAITNGTVTGSLIANTSGNYSIPVQAGTHTVTPVLENPTYFTISSPTVNVTFPTQASPFTQNFCITANGVHPDLEVTLLPISSARPGFNATYKLIYKNKGNTTQSGTVFLYYNPILIFVSANPNITNQVMNNLSWNFTNLVPFESREIELTFHANPPPTVNSGDILQYSATITSAVTDNTPVDNVFVLNQTVVNSFDPNDKTCLEGGVLTPDKIGDYVHYMIRFENTGTTNAQNIVVKDLIDTTKFDINSLVPMKGSHSFVTNITAGNKVEFIFENINLPFDDANNDGYVAFKIKTKPTLHHGDTFSNTASIYFDYNAPIVTNTATAIFTALNVQDFEFSNYFNVYPNPVHEVLNISAKQNIEVSSVNIYNMLGQLVLVIPNAKNTKSVDVSSLKTGNYFIKINSDKGTSNTKFIKN